MRTNISRLSLLFGLLAVGCANSHGRPREAPDRDAAPMAVDASVDSDVLPAWDSSIAARPDSSTDSGGTDSPHDAAAPTAGLVASGHGELVDMFVAIDGLVLVLRDEVRLVSRDGAAMAHWTSPREITAAAFDDAYVAVADRAALTGLNHSLAEVSSALLTEPCAAGVIVQEHRFVCGPENDWDRVFYTYDLATGSELARSSPETYNGIPMTRVPGADAFITVTLDITPADYHLYRLSESGRAEFINESPYHGDFPANGTYAFVGSPATHLITHEGLLLRFDACTDAPRDPGCFARDGLLGTLRRGETFASMATGQAGLLYALVDGSGALPGDARCATGCVVQQIDIARRAVAHEVAWATAFHNVVALREDPITGSAVIATHAHCSWDGRCSDWSVRVIPFAHP
jgi:hypothetical protein